MDLNINDDIQTTMSHEMINLMLNNLLKEARTSKIIEVKNLSQLPAVQENWTKPPKNQLDTALSNIQNANELIIKLEPEIDDFEFENSLLDVPKNLSVGEYSKQEPGLIVRLENLKVIEENGKFILKNQHQILNSALARAEMINLMLNNLLKEARTSKIIEVKNLSQRPAVRENWTKPTKNQLDTALSNIQNANELIIKLEPEIDDFEFENSPLDVPNHPSVGEYSKQEPGLIVRLENLKVIEQNGKFILKNQHQILNSSLAPHKEPFSNQGSAVKVETNEGINAFTKMHETIFFKEWQIKNEEVDIKEEDLEHNEMGILVSQAEHKKTLQRRQKYQTRKRNLNYRRTKKSKLKAQHPRRKISEEVNVFKCDQCEFQTVQKTYLNKHLLWHMNPEKVMLKCDKCKFETMRKSSLNRHLLRHMDPKNVDMFKCDQCDYQTFRKYTLKRHLLLHITPDNVNMFKCDQCEFQTTQKSYLNRHLLRHTYPEEVNNMFKCDQCKYKTISKGNLKDHLLWHKNPEKVNMFKCNQCDFQTIHKQNLKFHSLQHMNKEEIGMFKCDLCDFQTVQIRYLKSHYLCHKNKEDINIFKCYWCEFQTIYKKSLRIHLIQHRNPKNVIWFKCDQCDFRTIRKRHLKKHFRQHIKRK